MVLMILSLGAKQNMAVTLSGLDITYSGIINLLCRRPIFLFQADQQITQFGKFCGE
jgi:hypothetical protein